MTANMVLGEVIYILADKTKTKIGHNQKTKAVLSIQISWTIVLLLIGNRAIFFASERLMEDKTDLENINQLKQKANCILNGFGNIYRIGFDELQME